MVIIDMEITVTKAKRKQLGEPVSDTAENAPGNLRAHAKSANIGPQTGIPTSSEIIAQHGSNDWVGPITRFGLCEVAAEHGLVIHIHSQVPYPGACKDFGVQFAKFWQTVGNGPGGVSYVSRYIFGFDYSSRTHFAFR